MIWLAIILLQILVIFSGKRGAAAILSRSFVSSFLYEAKSKHQEGLDLDFKLAMRKVYLYPTILLETRRLSNLSTVVGLTSILHKPGRCLQQTKNWAPKISIKYDFLRLWENLTNPWDYGPSQFDKNRSKELIRDYCHPSIHFNSVLGVCFNHKIWIILRPITNVSAIGTVLDAKRVSVRHT